MTLNTILLQVQAEPTFFEKNGMLIMMVGIFAVMYFLMIRPQQKRQKELTAFRNSIQKGTKVITAGGIYGTVREVAEGSNVVTVEIDNNTHIKIDRAMIMRDPSDVAAK